jgi:hypothetical protein
MANQSTFDFLRRLKDSLNFRAKLAGMPAHKISAYGLEFCDENEGQAEEIPLAA